MRGPAAEGQELAAALAMPASRGRAVDAPWPGGGGRSLMRGRMVAALASEEGDWDRGGGRRMDKKREEKRKGKEKEKGRKKRKR